MSTGYWQRTITNDAGDIIANATIEVREPSADFTGSLVSLVDIDGTGLSNPFNADSEGFARFGADPQLVDIRATGSGSQRTWRRVEVLGTAATQSDDRYAHRANNLSDLANAGTARDNLGLGTAAVADLTDDPNDNTSGRALRTDDAYAAGSKNLHQDNTPVRPDANNLLVNTATNDPNAQDIPIGSGILNDQGQMLLHSSIQPLELARTSGDTDTRVVVQFWREGVEVGAISTDGTSTSYNTSSDYRLKEDLQPIYNPCNRVMLLNPVNFAWKLTGEKVDGFIAHEAQEVVPESVTGEKDAVEPVGNIVDEHGEVVAENVPEPKALKDSQSWVYVGNKPVYQGIDQAKLVPLLTAALQDALSKIENLESRVAELENA